MYPAVPSPLVTFLVAVVTVMVRQVLYERLQVEDLSYLYQQLDGQEAVL